MFVKNIHHFQLKNIFCDILTRVDDDILFCHDVKFINRDVFES